MYLASSYNYCIFYNYKHLFICSVKVLRMHTDCVWTHKLNPDWWRPYISLRHCFLGMYSHLCMESRQWKTTRNAHNEVHTQREQTYLNDLIINICLFRSFEMFGPASANIRLSCNIQQNCLSRVLLLLCPESIRKVIPPNQGSQHECDNAQMLCLLWLHHHVLVNKNNYQPDVMPLEVTGLIWNKKQTILQMLGEGENCQKWRDVLRAADTGCEKWGNVSAQSSIVKLRY